MNDFNILERNPFYTWFVSSLLIGTGVFWSWHSGLLTFMVASDITGLVAGIMVIFALLQLYLGLISYKIEKSDDPEKWSKKTEKLWFQSKMLPVLGVIGTFIGLSFMFTSIGGILSTTGPAMADAMRHTVGLAVGAAIFPSIIAWVSMYILNQEIKLVESSQFYKE